LIDDQLLRIARLRYLKDHHQVAAVLQEETRLRQALQNLDRQAREQCETGAAMQLVGADIVWQSWLDRSRRTLNMELAQLLGRKETVLDRVRQSFGRQTAIQSMLARQKSENFRIAQRRFLESLATGP